MAGSVISAGASIIGASKAASASKAATAAQERAAANALALQERMYDEGRADLAPYRTSGSAAQNRLSYLMGLDTFDRDAIAKQLGVTRPASTASTASTATTTPSGALYVQNVVPAGRTKSDQTVNYLMSDGSIKTRNDLLALNGTSPTIWNGFGDIKIGQQFGQAPATTTNTAEQNAAEAAIDAEIARQKASGEYGSLSKKFTMDDYQADPGYQFRLDQGNKAINAAQAARGGFYSGAALKAANEYGGNMASQEYGNAYNRYQTDTGTLYSRLGGLANTGMGATNTAVGLGQNYANSAGGIYGQLGNAQAAGAINQSNIYSQLGANLGSAFGGGQSSYGSVGAGLSSMLGGTGYGTGRDVYNLVNSNPNLF
jgi:hypothetical protein